MRQTRDMTILTVEDCLESVPPELLKADNETIQNEIPNYFRSGHQDILKKTNYVVFCTPDLRYISIKNENESRTNLDERNW